MKKLLVIPRHFFFLIFLTSLAAIGKSQVGIGTNTVDSSAMLEVVSNTRGFLPPRMTATQIFAIQNPKAGLMVYNTTKNQPVFFNGTEWKYFCGDSTMYNGDISFGLIAYFPFDGDYNDKSGKGNNGVVSSYGGSLTSDYNNTANSAFNCNGNGQELVVTNNGQIQFDSVLTVSYDAMIRTVGRHHFVSMVNYNTGAGVSFSIGDAFYPNNTNVFFSVVDNTAACNTPNTGPQSTNQDANFSMLPNVWSNIVCIYKKGVMTVYVNGVLYSTKNSNYPALKICPGIHLLIGGWWQQDTAASLNGKIDEVRLYNRQINIDEIRQLSKKFR